MSSFLLALLPSPIVANTLPKASGKLKLFLEPHVILFFILIALKTYLTGHFELKNLLFNVLIYLKSDLCLIFVTSHGYELENGSC